VFSESGANTRLPLPLPSRICWRRRLCQSYLQRPAEDAEESQATCFSHVRDEWGPSALSAVASSLVLPLVEEKELWRLELGCLKQRTKPDSSLANPAKWVNPGPFGFDVAPGTIGAEELLLKSTVFFLVVFFAICEVDCRRWAVREDGEELKGKSYSPSGRTKEWERVFLIYIKKKKKKKRASGRWIRE
jgi:hypothetical protein